MDHLHDQKFDVLRDRNDIPDFVKTASVSDNHTLFAYHDGLNGYFPIDTPHDTWLSQTYFVKNASQIPEASRASVAEKLVDAMRFHEITWAPFEKQAEEDELTKLASELDRFEHNYHTLEPQKRHEYAKTLRDRFEQLKHEGMHLPERIKRYAGEHLNPKWHDGIVNRLRINGEPKARADYNALLDDSEHIENENPLTVAKLLEYLDRKHGMHQHWDKRINDPYMDTITHEAPPVKRIIIMKINKRPYYDSDLERVDKGALREHLSEDAIDELFEHKESFDKLPEEIKHVLARLMSA